MLEREERVIAVKVARPFYAYMLRCSDGSHYVGHTDELERRLAEHETGAGSGYTAARQPVRLVWFEEFPTLADCGKFIDPST